MGEQSNIHGGWSKIYLDKADDQPFLINVIEKVSSKSLFKKWRDKAAKYIIKIKGNAFALGETKFVDEFAPEKAVSHGGAKREYFSTNSRHKEEEDKLSLATKSCKVENRANMGNDGMHKKVLERSNDVAWEPSSHYEVQSGGSEYVFKSREDPLTTKMTK
ncbi:hypothetical protein Ancab_028735 [Ancistrocladus abbreviatus]